MTIITQIKKIEQPAKAMTIQKEAGRTEYYETYLGKDIKSKYACIRTYDSQRKDVDQVIALNRDSALDLITLLRNTFSI